jgi:hypothetical protein
MAGAPESATRRVRRSARWHKQGHGRRVSLESGGSPGYGGGLRLDRWETLFESRGFLRQSDDRESGNWEI